jgi:aspartyl-tRNA(Asn)/glutamyl-tRNA(Gln) amidotransferase subunit B
MASAARKLQPSLHDQILELKKERQAVILDAGGSLVQETRGWSEERGETYRMRVKETSDDYRYFPEPDLPPLHLDDAWLDEVRARLPELPAARRTRYRETLGLSAYDASVLVADPTMSRAFEAIHAAAPDLAPKDVANFVTGPHAREMKTTGANAEGLAGKGRAADIATILAAIQAGTVSRQIGRDTLEKHLASGESAKTLLADTGPGPVGDDATLLGYIETVLAANPKAVADHHAGKPVIGFLVGQVMKASAGAADAARTTELLRERLKTEG